MRAGEGEEEGGREKKGWNFVLNRTIQRRGTLIYISSFYTRIMSTFSQNPSFVSLPFPVS